MAKVIALMGFMGSGKSTVGRLVARALEWGFVDLDEEIERRDGRDITRIFAEDGEAGFRELEGRVLSDLLDDAERAGHHLVIALGGGTVTVYGAWELLRGRARVVYLETPTSTAWERVRDSDRPLATSEEAFSRLAVEREAVYRASADDVVPTAGLSPDDVAVRVMALERSP